MIHANQIRWLNRPISVNELPKFWIPEYRANRYLKPLTDSQLQTRIEDILSNLMALGDDGKYRPRYLIGENRLYRPIRNLDFLRMLVDIDEECRLRGNPSLLADLPSVNLQLAQRLADETWCRRPDWVEKSRLSQEVYQHPRMLFRFSERKHNRSFFEAGEMHLQPASAYDDPSLNNALADDECVKKWYGEHGIIKTFSVPDYYCICFAATYDVRLFRDFRKSDFSCVAIGDVLEFTERLRRAIKKHNGLHAETRIQALITSPVIYYDPFSLVDMSTPSEVYFSKHFRFAYQEEFRLVVIPAHSRKLQPFSLNIGAITDIAEFMFDPLSPSG
jgi:hypothetical protein